jgi:hypothetical protein
LKNGATSLQISKEFTEYYNANKSNIHFYENYFSNLKFKPLEENNQKQERKLKRQRDSDGEDDEDDEENKTDWLSEAEEEEKKR